MSRLRVEWHGRSDFAAYAEALGIATDQIMGVAPGNPVTVLFTLRDEPDPIVWAAFLSPDAGGVLHDVRPRREVKRFSAFLPQEEDEEEEQ